MSSTHSINVQVDCVPSHPVMSPCGHRDEDTAKCPHEKLLGPCECMLCPLENPIETRNRQLTGDMSPQPSLQSSALNTRKTLTKTSEANLSQNETSDDNSKYESDPYDDSDLDQDWVPEKNTKGSKVYIPGEIIREIEDQHPKDKSTPTKSARLPPTTPSPYRKKRGNEEHEWRKAGGKTPRLDLPREPVNNVQFSKMIHVLAKVNKINLRTTPLKPWFFKEFVNKYGPDGAKYFASRSAHYTMVKWRLQFCVKKENKKGIKEAGVHLYDEPQEEMRDCPHCQSMDEMDAGVTNQAFEETQSALEIQRQENNWLKSKLAIRNLFDNPSQNDESHSTILEDESTITSETISSKVKCLVDGCRSKGFSSKKSYNQHMKIAHKEIPKHNDLFVKISCKECQKMIMPGYMGRHLLRDCRMKSLKKCEYCGSMIPSQRLKDHQMERKNGKGGCKNRHKSITLETRLNDPKEKIMEESKIACKICGKIVLKRSMNRHIRSLHKGSKIQSSPDEMPPPISKSLTKDVQIDEYPQLAIVPNEETMKKSMATRFQKPCFEWDEEALQLSSMIPSSEEMVKFGINWMSQYGVNVQGIGIGTKPDGNCLQRASLTAMGRDSSDDACLALRQHQVEIMKHAASAQTDNFYAFFGMPDQNIAPEEANIELDVFKEIDAYSQSGIFQTMGDAAPFSLAAASGHPIGILSMTNNDAGVRWVPPDGGIFTPWNINHNPILLVQRGNSQNQAYHFEPLVTKSEESATIIREMYLEWYENERKSEAQVQASSLGNNQSIRKLVSKKGIELESPRRLPLDKSKGDYKKLTCMMTTLHEEDIERIKKMNDEIDNIYLNFFHFENQVEQMQAGEDKIIDLVKDHAKWMAGEVYDTVATTRISRPKVSSSSELWIKVLQTKILPWLRKKLKSEGFKVPQLMDFTADHFPWVTLAMVEACHQEVGNSQRRAANTKWAILYSWQILCAALIRHAKASVNQITTIKVREIREWYEDIIQEIGKGKTRMWRAAKIGRAERSNLEEESNTIIPLNQAILLWYESPYRHQLIKELRSLSTAIRSGENVDVTSVTYNRLLEVVRTELVVPFPIRAGAWGHITVRAFSSASPSWYSTDPNHDVTSLPPNSCEHQIAAVTTTGKLGLDNNGMKCCDYSIQPDAFIMPNLWDKIGGDKTAWLVLSLELHSLIRDFLVVRETFFRNNLPNKDEGTTGTPWYIGDTEIFIKASGNASKTSDLILNHFNLAVYGDGTEVRITPQLLRKWNTTWIKNHPVPEISAMRGAVTGNSDRIFDGHYDLKRIANFKETLLENLHYHRGNDISFNLQWTGEDQARRDRERQAIEEADFAAMMEEEAVDHTRKKHPIAVFNRLRFKKYLESLNNGLWTKGGRRGPKDKKVGLTQLEWLKEVLLVLGGPSEDAENLRQVVISHYRGNSDPALRRWSGAHTHQAEIERDILNQQRNGIKSESTKNCPLLSTLKTFYRSAEFSNSGRRLYKRKFGEDDEGSTSEDDMRNKEDEEETSDSDCD